MIHGGQGDLGVPVVGRGDDHGVDVLAGDDLAVVERAVALEVFGSRLLALLVHVADLDDLQAIVVLLAVFGESAGNVGAAAADADDADVNAVVCAKDATGRCLGGSREGGTGHGERHSRGGRLPQKISSIGI